MFICLCKYLKTVRKLTTIIKLTKSYQLNHVKSLNSIDIFFFQIKEKNSKHNFMWWPHSICTICCKNLCTIISLRLCGGTYLSNNVFFLFMCSVFSQSVECFVFIKRLYIKRDLIDKHIFPNTPLYFKRKVTCVFVLRIEVQCNTWNILFS